MHFIAVFLSECEYATLENGELIDLAYYLALSLFIESKYLIKCTKL